MRSICFLVILMHLCSLSASFNSINSDPLSGEDVAVLLKLKSALSDNPMDLESVIGLCYFPLRIDLYGEKREIASADELRPVFDVVFSKRVREKICSQDLETVFKSYRGLMIGGGEVWLDYIADSDSDSSDWKLKIVAVNNRKEVGNRANQVNPHANQ